MRKILLLTLLGLPLVSNAATTGTLYLKGQVGQVLSIEVTPETMAATLPLDISQVDTKIATVTEISNSSTGYNVSITSANLGNLLRTGGTELFPYTLKYNGSSVNLLTGQTFTNSTTSTVNVNKDIQISYTGIPAENMVVGEYVDVVTFTIAVN